MTIERLIKTLQEIKKEIGNVPVVMANDSEGNNWGTLKAPLSFCRLTNNEGDKVLGLGLFPYDEYLEDYEDAIMLSR